MTGVLRVISAVSLAPLLAGAALPRRLRACAEHVCTNNYTNRVVYTSTASAGLGDRAFVLTGLGNLATSLCATLEVPPPHALLGRVSLNATWDAYLSTERYEDGGSFLKSSSSSSPCEEGAVIRTLDERNTTRGQDRFVEDYVAARRWVDRGEAVCWVIARSYWRLPVRAFRAGAFVAVSRDHRPPRLGFDVPAQDACDYVRVGTSDRAIAHAHRALGALGLDSLDDLATIHVRAHAGCNTTVAAVIQYLACSGADDLAAAAATTTIIAGGGGGALLQGGQRNESTTTQQQQQQQQQRDLLFFSDEARPAYRDEVCAAIAARFPKLRVTDGDRLLASLADSAGDPADSTFTYVAAAYLTFEAGASYQIHRWSCRGGVNGQPPCGQRRICHPCAAQSTKHLGDRRYGYNGLHAEAFPPVT